MDIPSLIKKLIAFFIFFLPFQRTPTIFISSDEDSIILKSLGLFDEFSLVVIFIVFMTFIALRPSEFRFKFLDVPVSKPLIGFISVALCSLFYNKVPLTQGVFGIIDIIKNIMLFYVISALPWDENDLVFIVRGIVCIVLILAVVGIIAEILAKFGGVGIGSLTREAGEGNLRLGLYRVSSLVGTGQINYLAIYGTLAFFLIFQAYEGHIFKYFALFLIATLIFFTFSRQGWACFIFMLIMRKRRYIIWAIPILLLATVMTIMSGEKFDPEVYFRGYAYLESLRALIDHPFIGIGPGRFGDLASILFESSIYESWPKFFREFAYKIRGVDCFWPIIWAEFGFIGLFTFSLIFFRLFASLEMIANWFSSVNNVMLAEITTVMRNYVLVIVFMAFATGFNTPFIVYTFFSLSAILYSIYRSSTKCISC